MGVSSITHPFSYQQLEPTQSFTFNADNLIWYPISFTVAALAEAGNFEEAVRRQEQALELLHRRPVRGEYQARLSLYKARKPFRLGFGNAGR